MEWIICSLFSFRCFMNSHNQGSLGKTKANKKSNTWNTFFLAVSLLYVLWSTHLYLYEKNAEINQKCSMVMHKGQKIMVLAGNQCYSVIRFCCIIIFYAATYTPTCFPICKTRLSLSLCHYNKIVCKDVE